MQLISSNPDLSGLNLQEFDPRRAYTVGTKYRFGKVIYTLVRLGVKDCLGDGNDFLRQT